MGSGTNTDGSSENFVLVSPSSKTSPREQDRGCPRCGGNCASLDTIRPLWLFPPRTSAPLIDGLGSSSSAWPTPTVCGNDNRAGASPTSGDGLGTAVKASQWPTPTASTYGSNQGGAAGRTGPARPSLAALVKTQPWPTPKARDTRSDCKSGMARTTPDLPDEVLSWATPRASDGSKGGPNQRGTKGDESLSMQASGTLNPEFVEVLMGFPQGWTDTSGQPDEAPTSTSGSRHGRCKRAR